MKIYLKVKTKAKEDKIEKVSENTFFIFVKEPPERGRANAKIIKLFSKYFKVSQSDIRICSGATSKTKIIEII